MRVRAARRTAPTEKAETIPSAPTVEGTKGCLFTGAVRNALPAYTISAGKIPGGAGQKRLAPHFVRIAPGRRRKRWCSAALPVEGPKGCLFTAAIRNALPAYTISAGKIPGGAGQKRLAPHFVRIAPGRSPVHNLFTEIPIFVLAFSGRLGYDVLALRGKEC